MTSLELVLKYFYQYVGVGLIGFGSLGCIVNILVFTQKTLRKNTCSIYFIGANISDISLINSLFLATTLDSGFNISINTKSLILCRLCYYTSLTTNALSSYCLILASINRVLVTSPNVSTRRRSTLHSSYLYLIIGTIFWMLFDIPALIFTDVIQINENMSTCVHQPGFYFTLITGYSIFKESVSVLLLIIFGLWTVNNIRCIRRTIMPVAPVQSRINVHIINSKDRQFISMIFIDIIIFSIFYSIVSICLTRQLIIQYQQQSIEQLEIELFIKQITILCLHIPFCISCYTNLLVSKAYRNALKNVFLRN